MLKHEPELDIRNPHRNAPHHTILHLTSPHHITLHLTSSQHTSTHITTPHHTTLHHAASHCSTPYLAAHHCTTWHHTTLHCTTLHHTTPHHTSPHRTHRTTHPFVHLTLLTCCRPSVLESTLHQQIWWPSAHWLIGLMREGKVLPSLPLSVH